MRSYLKTLVVALSLGFTMVACANVDPYSENIPNQNGEGGSSDNGIEYISVLEDGDPVYLVVYGDEPHLRIDKSLLSGWTGDIVHIVQFRTANRHLAGDGYLRGNSRTCSVRRYLDCCGVHDACQCPNGGKVKLGHYAGRG